MKRISVTHIKTGTFFNLPVIIELNRGPIAVLVKFPLVEKDVQEISTQLAELVEGQKDEG